MKQLRFTTTKPMAFGGMFSSDEDRQPLALPREIDPDGVTGGKPRLKCAYIHGDAEALAGFDIPVLIDGDICQFDAPEGEQDILMLLPDGEFPCKTYISNDYYLIILKDKPL